jgi:hypothetical protein
VTAEPDTVTAIVTAVTLALPEADAVTLTAHVEGLRLRRGAARDLLDYLRDHPDALISGRSDGPAVRLRLLDALAAEHPAVQRARCVGCDRVRSLRHRMDDGRACVTCYSRQHLDVCVRCGDRRDVARREADGGAVCPKCHRRDTTFWQSCSQCGKSAPVAARREGQPLCQNCWTAPLRTCVECGRDRPAHGFSDQGPLCGRCYRWEKAAECTTCGRLTPTRRRDPNSGAAVCERCWNPPVLTCADCRQQRPCPRGLRTGQPRCVSCLSRRAPASALRAVRKDQSCPLAPVARRRVRALLHQDPAQSGALRRVLCYAPPDRSRRGRTSDLWSMRRRQAGMELRSVRPLRCPVLRWPLPTMRRTRPRP